MERVIVGISGSSGIILGVKLVKKLIEQGFLIELIVSKPAYLVSSQELGTNYGNPAGFMTLFNEKEQESITTHPFQDFCSQIASGSFITLGMFIVPCSMSTVAAVAHGLSDNVLRRAADVCLKEKRQVIIAPREMPFSEIHLENLLKLAKMGVCIAPPVPAWYMNTDSLSVIEDIIVGRLLDQFYIHTRYPRWTGRASSVS